MRRPGLWIAGALLLGFLLGWWAGYGRRPVTYPPVPTGVTTPTPPPGARI